MFYYLEPKNLIYFDQIKTKLKPGSDATPVMCRT